MLIVVMLFAQFSHEAREFSGQVSSRQVAEYAPVLARLASIWHKLFPVESNRIGPTM